jgi:DNA-binding GntR family transcriptional regulator
LGESADTSALATKIAGEVFARISRGEYPMGTRLHQTRVAKEFGVSRTPVREALRILQLSGLIEVEPKGGATIRIPSPLDVREAYAVRAELEGMAAELAAQWVRNDDLERLRDAEKLFRAVAAEPSANDDGAFMTHNPRWADANDLFHRIVHEAARNEQLRYTIRQLDLRFPRTLSWAALGSDQRRLQANAAEHQAILESLGKRDAAEARCRMSLHVQHAGDLVVMWLEERQRRVSADFFPEVDVQPPGVLPANAAQGRVATATPNVDTPLTQGSRTA